VAAMQIGGTSKNRVEIWVMYEIKKREAGGGKPEKTEEASSEIFRGVAGLPETGSRKLQSPTQRFREERRREFLAKKSVGLDWSVGAGGGKMLRIISAWKYPGESPERDPIPAEILQEIRMLR